MYAVTARVWCGRFSHGPLQRPDNPAKNRYCSLSTKSTSQLMMCGCVIGFAMVVTYALGASTWWARAEKA